MFPVDLTPDLVRGALDLERTELGLRPHRLPAWARAQYAEPQIAMAESQPSGVRLVFRTDATAIELDTHRTVVTYRGAPPRPEGVYDLVVDGDLVGSASTTGGTVVEVDMQTGERVTTPGPAGTVRLGLPDGEHDVEIWLPTHETTDVVALRADRPVHPSVPTGRTWLHHGSSISHGSGAASPTTTWPALAARSAGLELINLGFGGSALLDPFTARSIRDTPADLISLKLGINVVNADLMRLRAFVPAVHGFLDTIREGHPTTPLLVVSAVLCPIHEDTPGPGAPDFSGGTMRFVATGDPAEVRAGRLTLRVVRDALERLVAQRAADDPHLAYLDGRELYGEADAETLPLPDALHPDAATHRLMGERFATLALGPGGPLAG
ncbi:GDSL-type esterase/lipase family protein [Actinomycetospora termitidis]|uniref:SGNH/GDSL hydrolase family protein n=1 Tax=Actinomycetospora termitidis TaxID=3053470 RepID=A0ABT7MFN4_9PSEU|nr:GDSL-type esterase/lipase family protein [Actinomycetospora sp. Odt1-22]MDL5159488.1 SGNH/GDSL hydrolase family protein [Actinomycetospora sp. Odt1-22]